MKWFKRLFIAFCFLLAVFAGAGFYISSTYEDILKQTVTTGLNDYLKTKVHVNSIGITSWKKFPYISLQFNDVLIEEDHKNRDTLLYAQRIFLNFDILDIYNGDYSIRNIELDNAKGYFKIDKKGKDNFHFWKSTESTDSSSFSLNLERVLLNDITFYYIDKQKDLGIHLASDEMVFDGDFEPEKLRMYINGTLNESHLSIDGVDYLNGNHVSLKTGIFVNNETSRFDFVGTEAILDKAFLFKGTGWFDDHNYLLKLASEELNYNSVLKYVGEETRATLEGYDATGIIDIALEIGGKLNSSKQPAITASFNVENAALTEKSSKNRLTDLSGKGNYKKLPNSSDELILEHISGKLGKGAFEGKLSIKNFKHPYIKLDLNGTADLKEWKHFFALDKFEQLEGRIKLSAIYSGRIKALDKFTLEEVKALKSAGTLIAENVYISRKGNSITYEDFSGKLTLQNNNLNITQLIGKIKGQPVRAKGYFANVFPFMLFEHQPLKIRADISSEQLDLNALLAESAESDQQNFSFPKDINARIKTHIKTLKYEAFEAQDISANVQLSHNELVVQNASFKGMGGKIKGRLIIKEAEETFLLSAYSDMKGVDTRELLRQFEGFGQSEIRPENISGTMNLKGNFKAMMNHRLEIDLHSVVAQADYSIVNGKLHNYQTLQTISDYFKENIVLRKAFKADELSQRLKEVSFYKIEHQLLVKNDTVHFPQMRIESNIISLNLRGKHAFTNHVNYHLDLNIRDYFKKDKVTETENGFVMDDGTGGKRIFLKVTGPLDNPEISFDKESRKAQSKQIIANETNQIKAALKEELGLFKNDTSVGDFEPLKEDGKGQFIVDWEEDDDGSASSGTKNNKDKDETPKTKEDTSTKKKWLKGLLEENDKESTSDFEVDEDDF